MCELMGLSFRAPVSADFSLREFARRDENNADGWGLGWYPDRALAVVKEPIRWQASRYTGFLENYHGLSSAVYIAHVRHGTTGGAPKYADTQPYAREWHGRDYCFAHNGTVAGFRDLPLGRYRPVGDTDSEHVFCHLLDAVAGRGADLDAEADWRWLQERLETLNRGGTTNFLMSDGRRLFCYHDRTGHKGMSLRSVRLNEAEQRRFEDADLRLDLDGGAHTRGYVVATQPLSPTGWKTVTPGEFMVFEAGELRYRSHRTNEASGGL